MNRLCINISKNGSYYLAVNNYESAAPVISDIGYFHNEMPDKIKYNHREFDSVNIILSAAFSQTDTVPFDRSMSWNDYERLLHIDIKLTYGKDNLDDFFITPIKLLPDSGAATYQILTQIFDLNLINEETRTLPDELLSKGKFVSSVSSLISAYQKNYTDIDGNHVIVFFEDGFIHLLLVRGNNILSYKYFYEISADISEIIILINKWASQFGQIGDIMLTGNSLTKAKLEGLRNYPGGNCNIIRLNPFRTFAPPENEDIRKFALKYLHIFSIPAGSCFE